MELKVVTVNIIILSLIIVILTFFFVGMDSKINRLEYACNEYDMEYLYIQDSPNCLDKNNNLHLIVTKDCSPWLWQDCDIRFIRRIDEG